MAGKRGRPSKDSENIDCKQKIIDTTIALIKENGADQVTVRSVCNAADLSIGTFYHHFKDKDDLMMYFVADSIFKEKKLKTSSDDPAGRIVELYSTLIEQYQHLGADFMKSFYTTGNTALSAYLGQTDGQFMPGSIMARSEQELAIAIAEGMLTGIPDSHQAASDICTIVKGCVFEWCLSGCAINLHDTINRIIRNYLSQ